MTGLAMHPGDGKWMALTPKEAAAHPLYGLGRALPALLAGFAWCGLSALARLGLLVYGLVLPGDSNLPLSSMVLTYMPVADAAFVVLFGWLAFAVLRPGVKAFAEMATIACGLYVLYVVPYVFAFRHLTDTGAFSLANWQTYVHYVVPVCFCLWAVVFVNTSRRVRATFAYEIAPEDLGRGPVSGA